MRNKVFILFCWAVASYCVYRVWDLILTPLRALIDFFLSGTFLHATGTQWGGVGLSLLLIAFYAVLPGGIVLAMTYKLFEHIFSHEKNDDEE